MTIIITDEKKKAIIDLYFNQHKTYRQLAQELTMSPRDLGIIVKEEEIRRSAAYADKDNEKQRLSHLHNRSLRISKINYNKRTEAYRLFSKGKDLIHVAPKLGLSHTEVIRYHLEYCKLKDLNELVDVYYETDSDLSAFLNLYNLIKTKGISKETLVNALKDYEELQFTERKIERA